jgi:transposase
LNLAQQLRGNFLTPVFHSNDFFSEMRKVVNAYENITRDLTRVKNRYKSVYLSEAILKKATGKKFYRTVDCSDELQSETSRFVAEALRQEICSIEEIKFQFRKKLLEYESQRPEIQALATIPGISVIRASIIAAAVCAPERFANKNKFWAYSMLVKHDIQSGGKSYGKESIFGKTSLKNVFMGAAQSNIQMNLSMRSIYDQCRLKGLDHKAAKQNLARKIAAISLAVMKTKKPYVEGFKSVESRKIETSVAKMTEPVPAR